MNGTPYRLDTGAATLANYPHARRIGELVFVSGVSSRRPDNSHDGVTIGSNGRVELDIRLQTRAVIENVRSILGAAGADLSNVVDVFVMLVDMKDYAGMNEIYNEYFDAATGPTRTTCAVHQLPHPHLLVEMKVIAVVAASSRYHGEA